MNDFFKTFNIFLKNATFIALHSIFSPLEEITVSDHALSSVIFLPSPYIIYI